MQRGVPQRIDEVADADRAMRLDQQARALRADERLELVHLRFAFRQLARHALRVQRLGQVGKRRGGLVGVGHLQGAVAHVRHVHARVAAHPMDEGVVAREAVGAELLEDRIVRAFDVRAEHARGGLRGDTAGRAGVEHQHVGALPRQRVRHGTPNQPGTDHDHIGTGRRRLRCAVVVTVGCP